VRLLLNNKMAAGGFVILVLMVLVALVAPLLPLADPNATAPANRLLRPMTDGHLLGTDALGRDILSRIIWGLRVSLAVGISATLIAAFFGSLIGLTAGYVGGRTDDIMMRGIDMVMAFPYILLALAIVAVLGPGLINALYAIAIVNIPFFARNIRGVTLGLSRREFVDAARMSGKSHIRILFTEILPNVMPVIVVTMSTTVGWMILETAGLSFLGLGAQPPQADLGSMLGDGRRVLFNAPHVAIVPGVVIFLLVMSINLFGDGVRDVLDPRLKSGALTRPVARTAIERPKGEVDAGRRRGRRARRQGAEDRVPRRPHRPQGGRRGRSEARPDRVPGHRRRIRFRQVGHRHVDHGAGADPARPHHRRRDPAQGRGSAGRLRRAHKAAARRRGQPCLPGPAGHAAPAVHRRRPDHRGDPRPPAARPCQGAREGQGPAGPGAHPQSRAAARFLPARTFGRHAPAGLDRHGAGQRRRTADRRRADDRARRDRSGADPGADEQAAPRKAGLDPVHHP
jgi:ABC-type dipeptide/oligopeptide/nickel transport system permease subunit